jgi:hypothetical protein
MASAVIRGLEFLARGPRALYRRLYWFWPDRRLRAPLRGIRSVVAFGASLGDNLLCTTVLEQLHRTGQGPVAILTDCGDLFAGLPFPVRILPFSSALIASLQRGGPRLYLPNYGVYNAVIDRHEPIPRDHLLVELCRSVHLRGEIRLSPILRLSAEELNAGRWADGLILIQSSAAGAAVSSPNKEWGAARFQEVVDRLHPNCRFVQVGSKDDPPLEHCRDLRGALGRRELAAALAHARLLVGLEGFLMHVARAVDCPAVIVFGGRVEPRQAGYAAHANLYSPVICAPCWRRSTCPHERMCLTAITPRQVVTAVENALQFARPVPEPEVATV